MWIEIDRFERDCGQYNGHATYVACGLKYDGRENQEEPDEVMPRMWHVD